MYNTCALILFIQTLALYKSFTHLLTYLLTYMPNSLLSPRLLIYCGSVFFNELENIFVSNFVAPLYSKYLVAHRFISARIMT